MVEVRYSGRAWVFDDLEEVTAINPETHSQFFLEFIDFGSTALFDEMVITPLTRDAHERVLGSRLPGLRR